MPVTFRIEGLAELRDALQRLPADLTDKAEIRILIAAFRAKNRIEAGYRSRPYRTTPRSTAVPPGDLKGKTTTKVVRDRVSLVATIKNSSKIAYLYENGTEGIRHTNKGWVRGKMPAAKVFIPVMADERRALYEDLKAIVRDAGLEVVG